MNTIGESVAGTLNSMAMEIFKLIGLYMLLPVLIAGILFSVLKIKGPLFKFLIGIVSLVGLYFLMTYGIQKIRIT